jgi:hypothetical protein
MGLILKWTKNVKNNNNNGNLEMEERIEWMEDLGKKKEPSHKLTKGEVEESGLFCGAAIHAAIFQSCKKKNWLMRENDWGGRDGPNQMMMKRKRKRRFCV